MTSIKKHDQFLALLTESLNIPVKEFIFIKLAGLKAAT